MILKIELEIDASEELDFNSALYDAYSMFIESYKDGKADYIGRVIDAFDTAWDEVYADEN